MDDENKTSGEDNVNEREQAKIGLQEQFVKFKGQLERAKELGIAGAGEALGKLNEMQDSSPQLFETGLNVTPEVVEGQANEQDEFQVDLSSQEVVSKKQKELLIKQQDLGYGEEAAVQREILSDAIMALDSLLFYMEHSEQARNSLDILENQVAVKKALYEAKLEGASTETRERYAPEWRFDLGLEHAERDLREAEMAIASYDQSLQEAEEKVQAVLKSESQKEKEKAKTEEETREANKHLDEMGDLIIIEKDKAYGDGRDRQLGRGAISLVLLGSVKGGIEGLRTPNPELEESPVAVKKALPLEMQAGYGKFTEEQLEHTHQEYIKLGEKEHETLESLRQKQQELFPYSFSHFPDSVVVRKDGEPVLVLEYIPRDYNIHSLAFDKKLHPDQLMPIMITFFEVLAIAHACNISISDKKGSDFYYFPDSGRVVVLDWNVTHLADVRDSSSGHTKEHGDLVRWLQECLGFNKSIEHNQEQGLPTETLRKLNVLFERLRKREDTTTAMDIIQILKNLESLSEEEISRSKAYSKPSL